MSNPVTVANSSAILAAEVLVEQIGIELAQKVNTAETVWVKELEGLKTPAAHYRWENAFSTAIPLTATEGDSLPSGNWTISSQNISTAFAGQSIPVGAQIMALDEEVIASVSRQTSTVLAREIDNGVCSYYPSFTQTSVGNSTGALTVAYVLAANAKLDAAHADEVGPYMGRLAPQQFLDLYNDIQTKNYGIAKTTVDAMGRLEINIGETIILKNTFVPIINSGTTYNGGIYVYQAIGLVVGMAPQVHINYLPGSGNYLVDGLLSLGTGPLRINLGVPVISGVTA